MRKWSDEDDYLIMALAADGLSAAQIAYKVGNVTRNAVIGRLHRLKVPMAKFSAQRIRMRKQRVEGGKQSALVHRLRAPRPGTTPRPTRKTDSIFADDGALQKLASVPDVPRVACLDDLEMHHCKYPIGDCRDGPMQFCGDQKVEGLPYCERHVHRCYVPVVPVSRKEPNVVLKVVA